MSEFKIETTELQKTLSGYEPVADVHRIKMDQGYPPIQRTLVDAWNCFTKWRDQ